MGRIDQRLNGRCHCLESHLNSLYSFDFDVFVLGFWYVRCLFDGKSLLLIVLIDDRAIGGLVIAALRRARESNVAHSSDIQSVIVAG